jgi:hypothetical protein
MPDRHAGNPPGSRRRRWRRRPARGRSSHDEIESPSRSRSGARRSSARAPPGTARRAQPVGPAEEKAVGRRPVAPRPVLPDGPVGERPGERSSQHHGSSPHAAACPNILTSPAALRLRDVGRRYPGAASGGAIQQAALSAPIRLAAAPGRGRICGRSLRGPLPPGGAHGGGRSPGRPRRRGLPGIHADVSVRATVHGQVLVPPSPGPEEPRQQADSGGPLLPLQVTS